jgi:uncharacterized membrane protein YdjX (TVP38/TMEM64 family)
MNERLNVLKPYLKGLILIVSLVAIGYGLKAMGLSDLFNTDWVDAEVKGKGLSGELVFVAVGAGFTAVGFPRQAVAFLAGYAFGFVTGSLIASAAVTLGCIAAFAYARMLGRSFVQRHFGRRIAKFDAVLADRPFLTTLLIRFLPVGSNVATNLIAGVSRVRGIPFILGSAAGYLPQTIVFVLIGSGVHIDPTFRIGLGAALFVASAAMGIYLVRHLRRARDVERAEEDDDPAA